MSSRAVHINGVEAVEHRRVESGIKRSRIEDAVGGHRVKRRGRESWDTAEAVFHGSPNIHVVVRRWHLQDVKQGGGVDIEVLSLDRGR